MSDLSPGPVSDQEPLHFVISDPNGLTNGSLNPAYLMQIDAGGLSVLRDGASDEEFSLTIQQLKTRANEGGKEWYFYGVCTFDAGAVRYHEAERFLCVYDTAMPDKPYHADLMGPDFEAMAAPAKLSKSEHERLKRRRHKTMIAKVGQAFIPAARFRDGKFVGHARPPG